MLRVPVLYGEASEPKESAVNVLMDALWKSQEKDVQVMMDAWAQRYPTNTEDVARVCHDISMKYLDHPEARQRLPKVLQFSSEDKMTKYEICQLFAEIMGLPMESIIAEEQGGDPKASVQRRTYYQLPSFFAFRSCSHRPRCLDNSVPLYFIIQRPPLS